jgi:hypothetical protein
MCLHHHLHLHPLLQYYHSDVLDDTRTVVVSSTPFDSYHTPVSSVKNVKMDSTGVDSTTIFST